MDLFARVLSSLQDAEIQEALLAAVLKGLLDPKNAFKSAEFVNDLYRSSVNSALLTGAEDLGVYTDQELRGLLSQLEREDTDDTQEGNP